MPRLYLPEDLHVGSVTLPQACARHVRALRLRAGDELQVFDGRGGHWRARLSPGLDAVELLEHEGVECELPRRVELAVGMPANERMDWLVEKATELGAAALHPLMTARAVLRLQGERAQRRTEHWRGVAQAACEQCGRNRVPEVSVAQSLRDWLPQVPGQGVALCVLAAPAQGRALPVAQWLAGVPAQQPVLALSGPEGGLDAQELDAALKAGFVAVTLGPRVLRADTAPLALVAAIAALDG